MSLKIRVTGNKTDIEQFSKNMRQFTSVVEESKSYLNRNSSLHRKYIEVDLLHKTEKNT